MEQNEQKFKIELTGEELYLIEKALWALEDEIGRSDLRHIAWAKRLLVENTPYFGGDDAKIELMDEGWKDFFEKTAPIKELLRKIYHIARTQVDEP